jgi:hypothetical protein
VNNKILPIAALTVGILLLAPAAHAVPIFDAWHGFAASSSANHGLQMAAFRASPNARFNRITSHPGVMLDASVLPHATVVPHVATVAGSTGSTGSTLVSPTWPTASAAAATMTTTVPTPGALVLLAAGLIGATLVRRRRRGHDVNGRAARA